MRRARLFRVLSVMLISLPLFGCVLSDWFGAFNDDKYAQQTRKEQAKKLVKADEIAQGIDQSDGNYRLTFTGENRTGTDFDGPNRTPAMLTDTALSAKETVDYSVGAEEAPAPARQTWIIEATRTGSKITGTAVLERWIGAPANIIITNTDTGETRLEPNTNPDPATTVTWSGVIKAVVEDDGTIAGTVEGTFSNSDGLSVPFKWALTGDSL